MFADTIHVTGHIVKLKMCKNIHNLIIYVALVFSKYQGYIIRFKYINYTHDHMTIWFMTGNSGSYMYLML